MKVYLVSCSGPKQATKTWAYDIYNSQLYLLSRRWVHLQMDQNKDQWYILSGHWGLLHPCTIIEPYEFNLTKQPAAKRKTWGIHVAAQLAQTHRSSRITEVIILAGKMYVDAYKYGLEQLVSHEILNAGHPFLQQKITEPLAGLQVGQRLSWRRKELEF